MPPRRDIHPLLRLGRAIEPKDLVGLLGPEVLVKALRLLVHRDPPPDPRALVHERDPAFIEDLVAFTSWVGERWFRHRALGLEHVPAQGPALLVGNHNGGLLTVDAMLTQAALFERFGPHRAMYGLAHDLAYWEPTIRKYAARWGAVPASHEGAAAAFEVGGLVLVYPGSDFDSFRPFGERNRVVLAHRTGFVRLALRARVPLVPVVTVGAHEAFVVVTRGEGLAKLLGFKRLVRSNVFPLALALPWGLTSAYLPYLPLPTQVTTAFLPPLDWTHLGPDAADDEATVRACYQAVEQAMQTRMDELTRNRVPLWG